MREIRVHRVLRAAPERVFDVLADHAGYGSLPGVRTARLVREGTPAPNGVGALRALDLGLAKVEEEITTYERPTHLAYRIVKSTPRIDHEGGDIRIRAVEEGCEVTWTSRLRVAVPLLSGLVTRIAVWRMTEAFEDVLEVVEQRAR